MARVGDLCWEDERHLGTAAWAAGDIEEGGIAVEDFEALADIAHADAGSLEDAAGMRAAGGDANAVIFDFDDEPVPLEAAAESDDAAGDARLESVLDAVFDQRLQEHAGDGDFERRGIDFLGNGELFRAEAGDFDGQIVVGGGELVAEGNEGVVLAEHFAENVGELDDELASLLGAEADERGDGAEGVEEEMRVDLALESIEAGFEQEALLFFEGALDADGVPDFERDADDHGGAGPDGEADQPAVGDEGEETAMRHALGPLAQHFHGNDEDEQEDLAIDAGAEERAADPAIEAEVDEGGEGPDFFLVDEAAVDAGGDGDGHQEGEGQEFAVKDSGQREHGGADEGGAGANEDAENDGGLEGDVGGIEVGDGDANQHAEAERHTDECDEAKGLGYGAFVAEEEVLEFARAPEGRGDSRGNTELDEQGDEDDARVEHPISVQRSAFSVQEKQPVACSR